MARGDEEFADFARASTAGLRHAAYLLTGDVHAAEDAVQVALVRTYASWRRVRNDNAFSYTRRIMVNYLIDKWRRRLKEYPADVLPETPCGDFTEEVVRRQWLREALATLTLRERAVIVMRYFYDLPETAVASDLGITVGTVKSTASRALVKIRKSAEDGSLDGMSPVGGDRN